MREGGREEGRGEREDVKNWRSIWREEGRRRRKWRRRRWYEVGVKYEPSTHRERERRATQISP